MNPHHRVLLAAAALAIAPGCGGDCAKKAERSLECPDGYVGYGRRTPDDKDWQPVFALADLAAWSADGTYAEKGRCESGCVPISLGPTEDLSTCDNFVACGGSLVGDWRWEVVACPYDVPVDLPGACAASAQSLAVSNDGTLTFEDDGTVRFRGGEAYEVDTVSVPASCNVGISDCQALVGAGDVCAGDTALACTCTSEHQTIPADWEGTYLIQASAVRITRNEVEVAVDYCVDGTSLLLDWEADAAGVKVRDRLFKYEN